MTGRAFHPSDTRVIPYTPQLHPVNKRTQDVPLEGAFPSGISQQEPY